MTKTIAVSDTTWSFLQDQGRKGESFDDILKRLLKLEAE